MPNTQFPKAPSEVAHQIGLNVRRVLEAQGRDLHWLADAIDVSVAQILLHFTDGVPAWLILDSANAMDVSASLFFEDA